MNSHYNCKIRLPAKVLVHLSHVKIYVVPIIQYRDIETNNDK